jgi:hypothetical protein
MVRPPARVAAVLLGLALVALLAPGASAGPRRNLTYNLPEDRLESFRFEVRQVVDTAFTRLPPESKDYDVDDLMTRIGHVDSAATGRLERVVARAFRDGSLGLVTRVESVEGTTERGEGARPLELGALAGKSLSLRVLSSGQVVDSFGWSHLSGAAGGGDLVADVLLQSVLRLPNTLPRDRPVMATWDLRIPVDAFLERVQTWVLTWTEAPAPADCSRCIALAYTGTVKERSRDGHPARPMSAEGDATIEGTLVIGKANRRLVAHRWTLRGERVVRSHRSNETLRGELTQRIELTGSIEAEER